MRDPIVIDPPGFDPAEGWKECKEYVDNLGGLTHDDGEVNWRAAFGADPGCCSCPNCKEMYWSWGHVVKCLDCGFVFPTDWWAMYSWGVQGTRRRCTDPHLEERFAASDAKRMWHAYFRYGFEHPVEDAWREHDTLPWKELVGDWTTVYQPVQEEARPERR